MTRSRRASVALVLALSVSASARAEAPAVSPVPEALPGPTGATWVRVQGSSGATFLAAVLRPNGAGPFPVVVVLHGSGGLTPRVLSVAEDVARAGFLVLVGCWQAGEEATDGTRICADATPQAAWVADPAAHSGKELIALARTLPGARADRVGLLGLSRGGHAALWAASTGAEVQAVVVDAPAHTPAIDPHPPSTTSVVAALDAPVLILHGTADDVIPVAQSREYERKARALSKAVSAVYFDGAGHVTTLDPRSRAEARARAIAFLRAHLAR